MGNKLIIILITISAMILVALFLFPGGGEKVQLNIKQENKTVENNEVASSESLAVENQSGSENSETPTEVTQLEDKNNNKTQENTDDSPAENKNSSTKITNKLVSWGYEKAGSRKIDTIIIHSTYNITSSDPFDLDAIIYKEYEPYGVSPHYIIDRDGKIYRLVEEKNIAYHAGESKTPDGRTGVNNFSIGIELVNSESAKPTSEQYSSLKSLISGIKSRYAIKYTLGHKDIAKGRKSDPWNFDWNKVK